MNGDPEQLGLNFDTPRSKQDGLALWREQRTASMRELARRLGLPLERHVEVLLHGGVRLRGTLRIAHGELLIDPKRDLTLLLQIDRCTFKPTEIEACVRLD